MQIHCEFGGNPWIDTVLYCVPAQRFFLYSAQSEQIHCEFGGKQYYCSRSRRSGAGWVPSGDFVRFGYYRADKPWCMHHQEVAHNIRGYAPILPYERIACEHPFVLSDGTNIVFLEYDQVSDALKDWEGFLQQGRPLQKTLEYFLPNYHDPLQQEYVIYQDHYWPTRPKPAQFIDFPCCEGLEKEYALSFQSHAQRRTRILELDGTWYYLSHAGLLERRWENDPFQQSYEEDSTPLPGGWFRDRGLFWRREEFEISLFKEIPRIERYAIPSYPFVEYEERVSIYHDWGLRGMGTAPWITYWHNYFDPKLLHKMREDWVAAGGYAADPDKTRELMQQHPDVILRLQHSLDAGNCKMASEEFMRKYNLPGFAPLSAILEHPQFEQMLTVFAFRKAVLKAINQETQETVEQE